MLLAVLLCFGCSVSANTISAPQTGQNVLFNQPFGGEFNGPGSDVSEQQVADDFQLDAASRITKITWYSILDTSNSPGSPTIPFVIRVFSNVPLPPLQAQDLHDRPALTPFYERAVNARVTDTGLSGTVPGGVRTFELYQFTASVPNLVVEGNTKYWLSILLNIDFTQSNDGFIWAFDEPGDEVFRVHPTPSNPGPPIDQQPWLENRNGNINNQSFTLLGPRGGHGVPDTGETSYLLGIAFSAIVAVRCMLGTRTC
jgi:hypothetical protein